MKTVAIITEYNPFHNGHKYQIDTLRAMFDEELCIVAIMSGSFVQRGEMAIADKLIRARAAVECGVDLVLELPFPFSMTSAEFFADSGVRIANAIGVVDYLAFGSECGDIEALTETAKNMLNPVFLNRVDAYIANSKYETLGHPAICELAYKDTFHSDISSEFFSPNNILALEYIKALIVQSSSIEPITIKREGAGYNDAKSESTNLQSATAIREIIRSDINSASDFIPKEAFCVYKEAADNGQMPTEQSNLDSAVISYFRLNSHADSDKIHDAAGGLYNRLCDMSAEATSISSLTSMTETKRFTTARIRRAIWSSYFGVTSSEVKAKPMYTQVLAMSERGRSLLKRIKKTSDFPIITKPADYTTYSEVVISQAERAHKADSIFALAHKKAISGNFSLRLTPYVKK